MSIETKSVNSPTLFRNNLLVFFLIFLLHATFKIIFLTNSGFWYGETFNLFYAEQDWGLIKHTSEWNRSAPLYYYFLWIWRNLFGIGEFAIRFSSIFFSALAAGLLYIIVSKHFNKVAAFIALLLFSSSNEIYSYSQEVSCQSVVLFLVMASFYFFFNLLEKKSISSIILLGICNFLLIYTQYITIIIPVFQMLSVLLFYNSQILKSTGISFFITLLLTFWRITLKTINCIFYPIKNNQIPQPTFDDIKNMFYGFFNGEILFWIFTGITLVTLGYLIYSKKLKLKEETEKIKFTCILFCGVGGMFTCDALCFLMPEVSNGYFLFTSLFLYILIGLLLSKLGNEIKYALVGLAIFFGLCSFSRMNFNVNKSMDYKNAVMVVKKLRTPETLILVETRDMGHLFAYYFDKNIFTDFKGMESKLNAKGIYLVSTAEDVKAIDLSKYKRIILTQTFETLNPKDKELIDYVFSKYKFNASSKRYADITLSLFGK